MCPRATRSSSRSPGLCGSDERGGDLHRRERRDYSGYPDCRPDSWRRSRSSPTCDEARREGSSVAIELSHPLQTRPRSSVAATRSRRFRRSRCRATAPMPRGGLAGNAMPAASPRGFALSGSPIRHTIGARIEARFFGEFFLASGTSNLASLVAFGGFALACRLRRGRHRHQLLHNGSGFRCREHGKLGAHAHVASRLAVAILGKNALQLAGLIDLSSVLRAPQRHVAFVTHARISLRRGDDAGSAAAARRWFAWARAASNPSCVHLPPSPRT